jgi:Na+/H+ antiporter NhaD/arsenite permease-like protein
MMTTEASVAHSAVARRMPGPIRMPSGIHAGLPIGILVLMLISGPALAADGLNGTGMSIFWILPFAALLLAIATGPLFYAHAWEHHQGKIAAACAAAVIIPLAMTAGFMPALAAVLHTMLLEYMSFIILLFALFTIAGGILITGNIHGSPLTNAMLLAIGAFLASFVGTTGASMIMIRPVIRANDDRLHNVHVVVFFIFLVSNIGGALTPLGDPPLFVGFLKGVDFFWTTKWLLHETLFVGGIVLAVFFALDSYLYAKEGRIKPDPTADSTVGIKGLVNIPLLGGVIAAILMSASWKPGIGIPFPGGTIELQNLARDVILLVLALVSLKVTAREYREANGFNWGPIIEVAKLFAAIFICIVPVIVILKAGKDGALAPLVALVTNPDGTPNNAMYFWLAGGLSSVLDNAPTYLVFFELAGGDPQKLMGPMALTLAAISSGAVYMGANTYIGNAPNFMVYAIAKDMKVNMPSFFGYVLWSMAVLIPTFVLATFVFFR